MIVTDKSYLYHTKNDNKVLEINVEEALLNYDYTPEEIKHMKEVEHVEHAELHERLEAYIEHAKPLDSAKTQKLLNESIIRNQGDADHGDGIRRALVCKDCDLLILFYAKG